MLPPNPAVADALGLLLDPGSHRWSQCAMVLILGGQSYPTSWCWCCARHLEIFTGVTSHLQSAMCFTKVAEISSRIRYLECDISFISASLENVSLPYRKAEKPASPQIVNLNHHKDVSASAEMPAFRAHFKMKKKACSNQGKCIARACEARA